jgi:hypothetical protein
LLLDRVFRQRPADGFSLRWKTLADAAMGGIMSFASHRLFISIAGCLLTSILSSAPLPPVKVDTDVAAQVSALEARLPAPKVVRKETFELSPQRQERLSKRLPETLRRASQREPLHILVLGNAGAFQMQPEEGKSALLDGFPGLFARELAAQFFYTGGVHEAGPKDDSLALNPGITLRQLAGVTGHIQEAASILASTARQAPVNLVVLCYGQDEALSGMSPVAFTIAVKQAVEAAHEIGAEVILCSPWLPMSATPEVSLGAARPLADSLAELAEREGLVYADLGDLSRLIDLPQTDSQDEGLIFDRLMMAYRGFFYETADGDFLPRASFHQRLGAALFKGMLDGASAQPYSLAEISAEWVKGGSALQLKATLVNGTAERLNLTLLPLIAAGWKPVAAQPQLSLPAGARQEITLDYAGESAASRGMQESEVRLPVLVISGKHAKVMEMRAAIRPLSIIWEMETLFNQEKRFSPACQLINASRSDQRGTWEATFMEKKLEGRYDLKAGATLPLDLSFDLTPDMPPVLTADLKVTLSGEGFALSQVCEVTLTRNLGLKQSVPLSSRKAAPGAATLWVEADARTLTLIADLRGSGMILEAVSQEAAAWQLEVCLDARSYGKRLEAGRTAPIIATGRAKAGKGHLQNVSPWAFGTGYAASFDAAQFQAALTTRGSEEHEIRLSLPRSYLYLHEWALENGNSQLGLSVNLTLNTSEGYRTWQLNPTTKASGDVAALAVLELAEKPTARVTVDVHAK